MLSRLARRGAVRRIGRGLYDIPHAHPVAGKVGASEAAIAAAIARREGVALLPSGATAANDLGLSTQVPATATYGVSGRGKTVTVGGKTRFRLRRRSPKAMALAGRASGHLAEALRSLGKGNVSQADLHALRRRLTVADRKRLLEDLRYVPAWMRPHFREVARDE